MDIITDRAYSFSQLGQRDNQEDARFPDTDTAAAGQRYFVVCDGVGGSDKGEDASRLVATTIGRQMQKLDLTQEFTDDRLIDVLDHAFIALDEAADKLRAITSGRARASSIAAMTTRWSTRWCIRAC